MNPAHLFRKSVAALNDWFEKAEREEMEQRMEVLHPRQDPPPPPHQRVSRDLDGSKVIDFREPPLPPAGIAEVVSAPKGSHTPPPTDSRDASMTPTGGISAGTRPFTPRSSVNTPMPDEIVFAARNDRAYRDRNRLVRVIGERYSRFGDSIASVVLQKCMIADGVQLLVTKLGLVPEGDDEVDHQQIVRFLEEAGVAKFCELVGVRASGKEAVKSMPTSTPKVKVAQNLSGQSKSGQGKAGQGESHVLQMQSVNVKPVSLGASHETPGEKSASARPAGPTPPPANPQARPLSPFPFTHRPMTPPPEDFQEPRHPGPKGATPVQADAASKGAAKGQPDAAGAAPAMQRIKAKPIPPVNREKPKESTPPVKRSADDFLREVTQEED